MITVWPGVCMDVIASIAANFKLCKVVAFTTALGSRFQVLIVLGKKEQP